MAWILLVAFLRPLGEVFIVTSGEWKFHADFRVTNKFTELIIQITTTGREQERVNQIISEIHAMALEMKYRIWVVNEPGCDDSYPDAEMLTVPLDFVALPRFKARALEFSRLVRAFVGLGRPDVKLVFLDDDTSPTREYLTTAFQADYDVCQGVTTPRVHYGSLPLRHYLLSHMDDLRLLSCLIYCSFFQGVVRRPLYVHGEGLCMTGAAEQLVTWNYDIIASEDLVFGENAVAKGLKWGFFHEYIQLTSPWTWHAFLKQRRRWLWGNLHAIRRRDVMPLSAAIMVGGKYLLGFYTFLGSVAAVVLILSRTVHVSSAQYIVFWAGFGAWLAEFALSGWINSARWQPSQRITPGFVFHRLLQIVSAVVLAPLTTVCTMATLTLAGLMGSPATFEVIAKTKTNGNGNGQTPSNDA